MKTTESNKNKKTQEELLKERMSGKLPVIDIAEHPFYVDVRMRTLRPHDDFSTTGIPFTAFDDYQVTDDFAVIPYDPKKHELKDIDFFKLTAIPNDWILVEIPHPRILDPYGYAREHGYNMEAYLKENPLSTDLKARTVPWGETNIPEIIERNTKKQPERKRMHKPPAAETSGNAGTKQGRKK